MQYLDRLPTAGLLPMLARLTICVALLGGPGGTGSASALNLPDAGSGTGIASGTRQPAGVRVPEGFDVTLFADDDLAHDIFSMTIDSLGRVVVSGPGYVRILIDTDGDGQADTSRQFADGPKTGAQGMYFVGRDLICVGDAGLIRYRDRNGDDRADGPPDLFLNIKAGGEHHAHAVRKGPEGAWYLVAGNKTGVTAAFATSPTSPIRAPVAGTLLRLTPDLTGGEIVCDGFRNVYDFDFSVQGDLFVFDSDGERDVSLPWYRPTRVFLATPGSSSGWMSQNWKRPAYFHDMPPVVSDFGRGSPAGVVCYRHRQFPSDYDGALFVLDWTFGRVMAVPLRQTDGTSPVEPSPFMTGIGQFGFAPTDVDVGPDGSLYVSVGGRGTRGGVFRVVYANSDVTTDTLETPRTDDDKLQACLGAPQPLSSWSRAKWVPPAKQLGREPFLAAAVDEKLTLDARIRAIEIATELFGGLDETTLDALSQCPLAVVRARAAWSIGCIPTVSSQPDASQPERLQPFLNDEHPFVARFALEALLRSQHDLAPRIPEIVRQLGSNDRYVRQAAARLVPRLSTTHRRALREMVNQAGPRAMLSHAYGRVERRESVDTDAIETALEIFTTQEDDNDLRLDAARLMQLACGDVGPGQAVAPVFESYTSRIDLSTYERVLDPVRIQLAEIFPTGKRLLDFELSRLLAMLAPDNTPLLDRVLEQITAKSHPVDDIHHLLVAARIPVGRATRQRDVIARGLISLEGKILARSLNQDSHWDDRIVELYQQSVKLDPELPAELIRQAEFGLPGHVLFMGELPREFFNGALSAFIRKIDGDDEYRWTNDVVFMLGESDDPRHLLMVRGQYDNIAVRSAVVMVLAEQPSSADREKFVEGLDSSQLEVLEACVDALVRLPSSQQPEEQFALLRTLRRLAGTRSEFALREKVAVLLRRNMQREFGFVFGEEGYEPQAETVAGWTEFLRLKYPEASARYLRMAQQEMQQLQQQLARVDWDTGDSERGERLFIARACAQCHGGRRALGPDLSGAAQRFSRTDLFTAIALPNRDVSPQYQTTSILTDTGKSHSGLIIYEAVDAVILRNSTNQTIRIAAGDVVDRRTLNTSLMPAGLLKDLKPGDLADLYAYMAALSGNGSKKETAAVE